jgi:hypothetical protein
MTDQSSNWPNLATGVTFVAVITFVTSLCYVAGLSNALRQNLFGLCDIADFFRIAPSWAIPALGSILVQMGLNFGKHKPLDDSGQLFVERQDEVRRKAVSRWVRTHNILFVLCGLIGASAAIFGMVQKNGFCLGMGWFFLTIAAQNLAFSVLPDFVRLFNLGYLFSLLLPEGMFICAAAFFWALLMVGQQTETLPVRTVTMRDHSVVTGNIVLDLTRYLVLKNGEGKVIAVQNSEIQSMEFLPEQNTKNPVASPAPSPSPVTTLASPSKK